MRVYNYAYALAKHLLHEILNINKRGVLSSWRKEYFISWRNALGNDVVYAIESYNIGWVIDATDHVEDASERGPSVLQEKYGIQVNWAQVLISLNNN